MSSKCGCHVDIGLPNYFACMIFSLSLQICGNTFAVYILLIAALDPKLSVLWPLFSLFLFSGIRNMLCGALGVLECPPRTGSGIWVLTHPLQQTFAILFIGVSRKNVFLKSFTWKTVALFCCADRCFSDHVSLPSNPSLACPL